MFGIPIGYIIAGVAIAVALVLWRRRARPTPRQRPVSDSDLIGHWTLLYRYWPTDTQRDGQYKIESGFHSLLDCQAWFDQEDVDLRSRGFTIYYAEANDLREQTKQVLRQHS